MADLIVVLDGAHAVDVGTHDELLARGGRYSELYPIQARASSSEPPRLRPCRSGRPVDAT